MFKTTGRHRKQARHRRQRYVLPTGVVHAAAILVFLPVLFAGGHR